MNHQNEDTRELREKMKEGSHEALNKLGEKYDQVAKKAGETREKTDRYIRLHPEKSVLMAAGIGALVAILMVGMFKKRYDNRRY
jgi:ElaB/YqjD/DUF883 family membrane-anchored ribosome-binding protein